MQLGPWTNVGGCIGTGKYSTCGPGNQKQTRWCRDWTTEDCTAVQTEQQIPCSQAGTKLPDCPG